MTPLELGPRRLSAAHIGALLRKVVIAREPGFAAIQSVVLQLLTVGANLTTGVAMARLLGPHGRGVYAAATSWPSMLGVVAVAGVGQAMLVGIRRKPERTPATAAWGSAVAVVCASVLAAAAWFFLPSLLGRGQSGALNIARTTLLLTYLVTSNAVFQSVFAGRGQFTLANLATYLPHLINAVAILTFALAGRLTVVTAIGCLAFSIGAAQLLLLPPLLGEVCGPLRDVRAAGAAVWSFAHRAAAADLIAASSEWSDRLLLIALLAPRELGFYVVAYGFSRVVAVATPTTGLMVSAMAASDRTTAKQLHDLALRFCIAVLVAAAIVAFSLSEPLIRIFYGEGFLPAAATADILVLQAVAFRVATVTSAFYMVCDRPGLNSAISVSSVVVSTALMVALTPAYGPPGAAIGLLAGTVVRLALLWIGLVTHLRVALPRLRPSLLDLQAARTIFRP
jgi:O-antigen/teichoic acid export membrane protein